MARTDPQIRIRLPQEVLDRLTFAAEGGGRSINAEIVRRLERSFDEAFPIYVPSKTNDSSTEVSDQQRLEEYRMLALSVELEVQNLDSLQRQWHELKEESPSDTFTRSYIELNIKLSGQQIMFMRKLMDAMNVDGQLAARLYDDP